MSVLERCPLYRGHEYYVTLKAPQTSLIERLEKCLDLIENPAVRKDSLSSELKMSRRKEVQKRKQQLESLQRIGNLDDK